MTTRPTPALAVAAVAALFSATLFAPVAQGQYLRREADETFNLETDDDETLEAVDRADAAVEAARARVRDQVRRIRSTWEADPEFVAMEKKHRDLTQVVDERREAIRERLMSDDAYREARQAVDMTDDELEDTPTSRPGEDGETMVDARRVELAEEKLDYKERVREAEQAALAEDEKAGPALAELDAMSVEFAQKRAELDKLLQQDSGYRAAQQQLVNARQRLDASSGVD